MSKIDHAAFMESVLELHGREKAYLIERLTIELNYWIEVNRGAAADAAFSSAIARHMFRSRHVYGTRRREWRDVVVMHQQEAAKFAREAIHAREQVLEFDGLLRRLRAIP